MNSYDSLKPGDEIRVIAPSISWRPSRARGYVRAAALLEARGFRVTFGEHVKEVERFGTGSVASRVADLEAAYADKNVRAIFALHGGWSANALLPHINWKLVRDNPKPFIGFSDITVLLNAISAMTGTINYLGPNFSSLSQRSYFNYTENNLFDVLTRTETLPLQRSQRWQRKRGLPLAKTRPWKVLQPGKANAVLWGGNIGTFYLVQGTSYQPRFDTPFVLAVEDDDEAGKLTAQEFDRRLESILQLDGARENISGLLVGRFQPSSGVSLRDVDYIVKRMGLENIPVIADMDFGHTWPLLTLPIGGMISISAEKNRLQVNLVKY